MIHCHTPASVLLRALFLFGCLFCCSIPLLAQDRDNDVRDNEPRDSELRGREVRNEIRDRHWGGGLEPAQYLDVLEQIRNMPDERDAKGRGALMRSTRWECIGPSAVDGGGPPGENWHGRMKKIRWYRNPANGSLETYLGASSGGIWLGTIFGLIRVWTSLGDNLPNPAVGAFLIDSLDPNVIWVGTGDKDRYAGAGLFKTTNRGATWSRVAITASNIVPSAITDLEYGSSLRTMYLSSSLGFFLSTDGGAAWSRIGTGSFVDVTLERMSVDPAHRDTLYLSSQGRFGLFKSINGGRTFSEINNGIRQGFTASAVIAVSPSSPNLLFAALSSSSGNTGKLYKSTNRGERWDTLPDPPEYLNNGQAFNDHAIAISPADPNRVYIGGVGLIRTTDGGSTWAMMRRPGHYDVTEIAYPPVASGYLMVLNDGGIFNYSESADDATNALEAFVPGAPLQAYSLDDAWSNSKVLVSGLQDNGTVVTDQAGTPTRRWWMAGGCDGGNTISIHPTNPSQIFFNSWCGPTYRLRSDDMGRTQVHINQDLGTDFRYAPIRMNKLGSNWLFTLTRAHLHYSSNGGETWLRATATPGLDFDTSNFEGAWSMTVNHHLDGPTVAYVVFMGNAAGLSRQVRMFRGTAGAMTMTQREVDRNNPNGVRVIAADRWSANVAYAMTNRSRVTYLSHAKIYRTTNAGDTWTSITGNLPSVNTGDIVASPTDPNTMYAATELGVFRTRDGGAEWESFQNGLPIVAANSFSYIRGTDYDTLRVATFGRGVYSRVLDGSDPVFAINPRVVGTLLRDVSVLGRAQRPFDFDTLVTVGSAGVIGKSTDGGRSFGFVTFPSKTTLRSVATSDPTHATIVGDGGTIIHTNTSAREWAQVASGVSVSLRGIAFSGPTGLIVGEEGVILRSTNSGGAWSRVHDEKNAILIGLSMPSAVNGWVSGSRRNPQTGAIVPLLLHTTDGGLTWIEWQTPPENFSALSMIDGSNGYGAGVDGALYLTTNGGSTWDAKPTGAKASLTDLAVIGSKVVYATTLDGRIIRTGDGGKSWKVEEDLQTPGGLYAIAQGTRELIAVGDSTVVLLRTGTHVVDTSMTPEYIEVFPAGIAAASGLATARIESIVPNPSSGATTIRFSTATGARVSLTIHSLLGEPIATLREERLVAGSHSAMWDGNDADGRAVPAGTYLIRIAAGGVATVGRVVIVR